MHALRLVVAIAAASLAACAHKPVSLACDPALVKRYPIGLPVPPSDGFGPSLPSFDAAPPPAVGVVARTAAPSVSAMFRDALAPRGAVVVEPASLLMMSGGGERGAFGAGLLAGWQERAGALPKFAVVTGISTGALLSTFAFVGRGDLAVAGYTIDSEADLVEPLGGKSPLGLIRKGAAADLVPLRRRIDRMLSDDILTSVAAESEGDRRRLLVGVVDVDDGEAYAYSLGEIARAWRDGGAARPALKACYIEAVVASSSAPPAAPPVFINDRQLIDGGARFGMFFLAADEALRTARAAAGSRAQSYLIVNGTLTTEARPVSSPHADWNILDLGLRSADILQNQVYRFSADYARRRTAEGSEALPFRFARIEENAPGFVTAIPGVPGETEALSCKAWQDRDTDGRHGPVPLQFQKRYMRCLIEYGRDRAARLAGVWYQARP